MPQTTFTDLRDLTVDFDTRPPFTVGQTVSGTVRYQPLIDHVDSTVHSVALNFWARSKTKLVRSNGQSTTTYRGRATLFQFTVPLTETYDMDAGQSDNASRSWRFSTTIPTTSLPNATGPDEWDAAPGFLFNEQRADQQHALPPTFCYRGRQFLSGGRLDAFIEYVFACRLQFVKPGKSSVKERITTVPVTVRVQGPSGPLVDLQLRSAETPVMVKTLQLLPEKQDVTLTFREKMRTTFQPSKIPQYGCRIVVDHPTIIQLGNSIFPFRLRHVPKYDEPTTNVPPEWYPTFKLTAFSLKIGTDTLTRTQRTFTGPREDHREDEETIYSTKSHPGGPAEVGAVALPPDPDQPFDLGVHLGLTVHRTRASRLRVINPPNVAPAPAPALAPAVPSSSSSTTTGGFDAKTGFDFQNSIPVSGSHDLDQPPSYATQIAPSPFNDLLFPTFQTYNIAQRHFLSWKIKLTPVGTTEGSEEHTVQGRASIVVVEEAPTMDEAAAAAAAGRKGSSSNGDGV